MNGKKVVHFVKTFDGALWAAEQVNELSKRGWEIHVVSPSLEGRYRDKWIKSGAVLHKLDCEFPVKRLWMIPLLVKNLKNLISRIKPDLIHSHFVSTTLMLRFALREERIPRIFQVPGPLHLEHDLFGQWETMWSDHNDAWIASSDFIRNLYLSKYGIPTKRIFKSYYGTTINDISQDDIKSFRERYGIPEKARIIGNVSFIYPPKWYLFQTTGLKGHELMIESILNLIRERNDVWGVFIGKQWGKSQSYFEKIKKNAQSKSDRIIFTGALNQKEILQIWKEFDLALHLPISENCGGVVEPMLRGVPTVASNVGGLPEVIIPHKTGHLTERNVEKITQHIRDALEMRKENSIMVQNGERLVKSMFDVKRTSQEVEDIYYHLLGERKKIFNFNSSEYLG